MAAEKKVPQIEMLDQAERARLDRTIAHLNKRQSRKDTHETELDSTYDSEDASAASVPTLEIADSSDLKSELDSLKKHQIAVDRVEANKRIPELAAVTDDVLNDYDDNQSFVKKFNQTSSVNLDSLTPAQRISFFELQIKELKERNDELLQGIDRKLATAERLNQTANLEILTEAIHKNQARIAELAEKIAEEESYQDEMPKFIEQEVTNLAEASGLTKEQISDLYSDNFISKLIGKGYTTGNWERTQALLNAEVKARAAAELAIFNFEFPGIKLDANGEPQIGFFGKLTGKLSKIKASASYQNYRAFTKLTNHILEIASEPTQKRPVSSALRSVGKIALAATAAATIGGPLGKQAAEITQDVSNSVSTSFVKKESKPEQKTVRAPEITSANFPDVVIAPTDIAPQNSETETRRRRQPLENFTEEDLGQAVNFTEDEGTEIVDTTASVRRAEVRKAKAIESAFVAPKNQAKAAETNEPIKPTTTAKPVGSAAARAKAKAITDDLFGADFDKEIKKPLIKKQEVPNSAADRMIETPVKRPTLSIKDTGNPQPKDPQERTEAIKKALRAASLEQAEEVAKRIAATGRSNMPETDTYEQDEEPTPVKVDTFSTQSRRGLTDLKPEITETKSGTRDQVRTGLSEVGKEAAIKIKESLTLRETLRTSLKNSDLSKVEQDAYFYSATKKFDSLGKKPAERAQYVAKIQKAAKAGFDQLIEVLNK